MRASSCRTGPPSRRRPRPAWRPECSPRKTPRPVPPQPSAGPTVGGGTTPSATANATTTTARTAVARRATRRTAAAATPAPPGDPAAPLPVGNRAEGPESTGPPARVVSRLLGSGDGVSHRSPTARSGARGALAGDGRHGPGGRGRWIRLDLAG